MAATVLESCPAVIPLSPSWAGVTEPAVRSAGLPVFGGDYPGLHESVLAWAVLEHSDVNKRDINRACVWLVPMPGYPDRCSLLELICLGLPDEYIHVLSVELNVLDSKVGYLFPTQESEKTPC